MRELYEDFRNWLSPPAASVAAQNPYSTGQVSAPIEKITPLGPNHFEMGRRVGLGAKDPRPSTDPRPRSKLPAFLASGVLNSQKKPRR